MGPELRRCIRAGGCVRGRHERLDVWLITESQANCMQLFKHLLLDVERRAATSMCVSAGIIRRRHDDGLGMSQCCQKELKHSDRRSTTHRRCRRHRHQESPTTSAGR
jgi:hypothetical protein